MLCCGGAARRARLPLDETEDTAGKDKEKRQGSTWGSLFGGAGQGGRSGGMSPTRNSEVKKAIRAAMAFGLPKGAGQETETAGDSCSKDGRVEVDDSRDGVEKGTAVRACRPCVLGFMGLSRSACEFVCKLICLRACGCPPGTCAGNKWIFLGLLCAVASEIFSAVRVVRTAQVLFPSYRGEHLAPCCF